MMISVALALAPEDGHFAVIATGDETGGRAFDHARATVGHGGGLHEH